MPVDELCEEYAIKGVKIRVRMLDESDDMVLIEGERTALEFLGKLFLSQAEASDCGLQIAPDSAGKALFDRTSKLGIYIHRVPCTHTK